MKQTLLGCEAQSPSQHASFTVRHPHQPDDTHISQKSTAENALCAPWQRAA